LQPAEGKAGGGGGKTGWKIGWTRPTASNWVRFLAEKNSHIRLGTLHASRRVEKNVGDCSGELREHYLV